jgi:putative membrane protein
MIRLLRLALLGLLALVLLTVALANRGPVTLRLLPEDAGRFLGLDWAIQLPLFLVIFAGILAGLAIGFVWEWAREAKHRSAASQHRREAAQLKSEVNRLHGSNGAPKDEVLALLETGARSR